MRRPLQNLHLLKADMEKKGWMIDSFKFRYKKRTELTNISIATGEATKAAQLTVMELQQTTVEAMKAASEDGKLNQAEIEQLGALLLEKALDKMSESAVQLLKSSGADICALIQGAGEAMIEQMKAYKK